MAEYTVKTTAHIAKQGTFTGKEIKAQLASHNISIRLPSSKNISSRQLRINMAKGDLSVFEGNHLIGSIWIYKVEDRGSSVKSLFEIRYYAKQFFKKAA